MCFNSVRIWQHCSITYSQGGFKETDMNVAQTSTTQKGALEAQCPADLSLVWRAQATFSTLSQKKHKKIHWASGNYNVSSLKGEFRATRYTVTFSKNEDLAYLSWWTERKKFCVTKAQPGMNFLQRLQISQEEEWGTTTLIIYIQWPFTG